MSLIIRLNQKKENFSKNLDWQKSVAKSFIEKILIKSLFARLKLWVVFLKEKVNFVITENHVFDYWDETTKTIHFGCFRVSGYWCKDLEEKNPIESFLIENNDLFQLRRKTDIFPEQLSPLIRRLYISGEKFIFLLLKNVLTFITKKFRKRPVAGYKSATCVLPTDGANMPSSYASRQRFCRHEVCGLWAKSWEEKLRALKWLFFTKIVFEGFYWGFWGKN